jgi:hypothetical protein
LVAEGVFVEEPDGSRRFVSAQNPPTDVEVAQVLAAVRSRVVRLLRRHNIDLEGRFDDGQTDPLWLDSPVLAQVQGASVLGRVATGPRADGYCGWAVLPRRRASSRAGHATPTSPLAVAHARVAPGRARLSRSRNRRTRALRRSRKSTQFRLRDLTRAAI